MNSTSLLPEAGGGSGALRSRSSTGSPGSRNSARFEASGRTGHSELCSGWPHGRADDPLAAVAVTHQLRGSIRTIAKRFWRMTDEDIKDIVTASMWAELRSFDWRKRTEHFGASLTYATRRAVRRSLASGHSGYVDGVVVPVDPQS